MSAERTGGEPSFAESARCLLDGDEDEAIRLLTVLAPAAGSKALDLQAEERRQEAEWAARATRPVRVPGRSLEPRRDPEQDAIAASGGDPEAALAASCFFEGAGDVARAEQVLWEALAASGEQQWPHSGRMRMRLGQLLEDRKAPEAGMVYRRWEEEQSAEGARHAARWCMEHGFEDEGRFRWRVLAEEGLRRMHTAVAYLDSERKTYRYQWEETFTEVTCWRDAMRHQMLLAVTEDNPDQARRYLEAVSDSYRWRPTVEDLAVNAWLEAQAPSLPAALRAVIAPRAVDRPATTGMDETVLLDWLLRTLLPTLFDLAGAVDAADALSAMPRVDGRAAMSTAQDNMSRIRRELRIRGDSDLHEAVSQSMREMRAAASHDITDVLPWTRAAYSARTYLNHELGLNSSGAAQTDRILAGQWIWIRMAASAPDSTAWIELWDAGSRLGGYALGLIAGRTAVLAGEHKLVLPEPGKALREVLDPAIPTLRRSLAAL